jgi:tetratricopeptide (TPR) repeat protein
MKSTSSLQRGLAQVRRDWRAGHYEQALAEVERLLEAWPNLPPLLTMRGNLIQLLESPSASLDDARDALQRAVDLDPGAPAAWLELGHFLDAVDDDPAKAAQCFDKTIELTQRLLLEGLLAKARALSQQDKKPEALACLRQAYVLRPFLRGPNAKSSGEKEISAAALEELIALAQAD